MSGNPIVAGTDGSPTAKLAMDRAGELAKALGAPVHVVCVPSALEAHEWPARISAQQIVAEASDRLQSQGVEVKTHLPKVLQGEAALALVAIAEQEHAQVLVVGNKGMTGIRRLVGSLPNRISHEARCDVLIVPTQSGSVAEFSGRPIVVGTDGSSGEARTLKQGDPAVEGARWRASRRRDGTVTRFDRSAARGGDCQGLQARGSSS